MSFSSFLETKNFELCQTDQIIDIQDKPLFLFHFPNKFDVSSFASQKFKIPKVSNPKNQNQIIHTFTVKDNTYDVIEGSSVECDDVVNIFPTEKNVFAAGRPFSRVFRIIERVKKSDSNGGDDNNNNNNSFVNFFPDQPAGAHASTKIPPQISYVDNHYKNNASNNNESEEFSLHRNKLGKFLPIGFVPSDLPLPSKVTVKGHSTPKASKHSDSSVIEDSTKKSKKKKNKKSSDPSEDSLEQPDNSTQNKANTLTTPHKSKKIKT